MTFTYDSATHKLDTPPLTFLLSASARAARLLGQCRNPAWPTSLPPQGVTRAQVLDGSALSYELVTSSRAVLP